MAATFLIDSPTTMLMGAVAATLGRTGPESSRRWFVRGFAVATIFLGTALAAYVKSPDWMWMYFLEPPDLALTDFAFLAVIVYYVPYVAGFYAAERLERGFPGKGGIATAIGALALNLYVMGRLWERYFHVGTLADFHAGRAVPLTGDHPLRGVLNLGGAAIGAAIVVLAVLWFRERRAPGTA